ncbi:hypothetical protein CR205_04150 [Alteribacter lacisalsi]|uniref:Uncharacterized protein n=1 Tax=Alteribacter lacisalsi TaxID=2045244 RepID=A0A2W0H7F1_9BACI|nr:hypothetical protein [Alteribacter lacisalsi]PYZ97793.1 hypothetical protein CR205_04150 [Alteribacter lacisalsi]
MYNAVQLGQIIIPYWMIYIGLSLSAAFLYLKFFSPFKGKDGRNVRDKTANMIILFAVVFQFGSALYNLPLLIRDPLAVLSYPSGTKEFYTGLAVVIVYALYMHRKKLMSLHHTFSGLFFVLITADFLFSFLTGRSGEELSSGLFPFVSHHPLSLYTMILSAGILVLISKNAIRIRHAALIFALGKWGISLFDSSDMFFHLYGMNSFYILLAAAALLLTASDLTRKESG